MKTGKRISALLLCLVLLCALLPGSVSADHSVSVDVTISVSGELVVMRQTLTVADRNGDGLCDVDEALYAAHESFYEGGAAGGYASAETQYGLSLTKLWGDDSGSFGYYVNNTMCMSLADMVENGDSLAAFVYADKETYSDSYAYIDSAASAVYGGEAVSLTLMAASGYDESWNIVYSARAGAEISVFTSDGTALDAAKYSVSDKGEGLYELTISDPGDYCVTASAEGMVPAVCSVRILGENEFKDTVGHWAAESISAAAEKGLVNGIGGGLFSPEGETSRAALATVLYRLEGSPEVAEESSFTDVEAGSWYESAMTWAAANNIVSGLGDGTAAPERGVTREEFAVMLFRYAAFKGYDTSARADFDFDDAGDVSSWALDAMGWAVAEGLITGRTEQTVAPQGGTTRAECAVLLTRFIDNIK